ncbi:MAG: EamA family transporter, partial [Methanomassiliicoccales archaeon]|nr:EamA family transporter [Methanomassiliicoccales archaeon]
GLRHIGMVNSSVIILSESAFAVFLSVLLLGEPLELPMVLGAALVFVAIFMVVRGGREAPSAT